MLSCNFVINEKQIEEYPCLKISFDKTIVLFKENGKGTVLYNRDLRKIGQTLSNTNMLKWNSLPKGSVVTITQE